MAQRGYAFLPTNRGFDSGGLAVHNLLRGDPRAAAYSFVDPNYLSPAERGEAPESGGWRPAGSDPWSVALRTVTNPLLILGAVLAMKYPIGKAADLLKWTEGISKYDKFMTPFAPVVKGLRGIFGGTTFRRLIETTAEEAHGFKTLTNNAYTEGLFAYKKATGRTASIPVQVASAIAQHGLNDAAHPVWGMVRGAFRTEAKAAGMAEHEIERIVAGIGRMDDPGRFQSMVSPEIVGGLRNAFKLSWEKVAAEIKGADASEITRMADALGLDIQIPKGMTEEKWVEALRGGLLAKEEARYFPHIHQKPNYATQQDLLNIFNQTPEEARARTLAGVNPVSNRMLDLKNRMLPSADDLNTFLPGVFSKETNAALSMLNRVPEIAKDGSAVGQKYRSFSLRATNVVESYAHSMGKTYAWTVKGLGNQIRDEVEGPMRAQAARSGSAAMRYKLALDTYVPLAMGKPSPSEAMYALGWSNAKMAAHKFFDGPVAKKYLGETTASWFAKQISKPEIQDLTFKSAGAKLAGMVYLDTLGLNPASAGLNLMQNLMTTAGVVPPQFLAKGFKNAAAGATKFISHYAEGGMTLEQAFIKAFPEYEAIGGISEIQMLTELRKARVGGTGSVGDKIETAKSALMAMFTGTERFNKLWAYHAGREWALAEKLGEVGSHGIGMEVMKMTQFPGGPLNKPAMMANWNPLLTQFTQFPLKTLELATSNPGTLGRMLIAGSLTYGAGQMAGLDLSRGLMFGALPLPEGSEADDPFFPLPIKPPIVQAAGAVASDLAMGEFNQTKRLIPMAVPGGSALARASTVMAPGLAEMLGRPYADYDNPQPDGSYPIYSTKGTLKGFKRPLSLFADAIGWRSLTGDPETELTTYLLKQRDRITGYRRDYIEAIANNNTTKARSINEEYQRAYPGMGVITVKPTDIRAVHLRHDVSRMERILESLPSEARAQFGQAVSVALGDLGDSAEFLGIDPAMLGTPGSTINRRDPARRNPSGGNQTQRIREASKGIGQGQQQGQQGGGFRSDQSGTVARPGFSGFEDFGSFN